MPKSSKKGKKKGRKRKIEIVEESMGSDIKNNNIDAKKRNVTASLGMEGEGNNTFKMEIGDCKGSR